MNDRLAAWQATALGAAIAKCQEEQGMVVPPLSQSEDVKIKLIQAREQSALIQKRVVANATVAMAKASTNFSASASQASAAMTKASTNFSAAARKLEQRRVIHRTNLGLAFCYLIE